MLLLILHTLNVKSEVFHTLNSPSVEPEQPNNPFGDWFNTVIFLFLWIIFDWTDGLMNLIFCSILSLGMFTDSFNTVCLL